MRVTAGSSRAIFVAPMRREAETWARAWGFARGEWIHVGDFEHLVGRRADTVFVCGSVRLPHRMLDALEVAGVQVIIDAHDLDTFHEPDSALRLVHGLRPI